MFIAISNYTLMRSMSHKAIARGCTTSKQNGFSTASYHQCHAGFSDRACAVLSTRDDSYAFILSLCSKMHFNPAVSTHLTESGTFIQAEDTPHSSQRSQWQKMFLQSSTLYFVSEAVEVILSFSLQGFFFFACYYSFKLDISEGSFFKHISSQETCKVE